MKGTIHVIVSSKRVKYEFTLRRSLTIVRGDSATGKTTLVDMVQEHLDNPSGSPVEVVCEKKCYVVAGALWEAQLSAIRDGIVFIDEGNAFVKSDDFARKIQDTDNYYVIVSREGLPALPYSVEEIYGIRTSGKYGTLKQTYNEFYRIYGKSAVQGEVCPEAVLTEDSNTGYEFFHAVCLENDIRCDAAGGKFTIFHFMNTHRTERLLVIADGAAFGSEMDKVVKLLQENPSLTIYLLESFEWIILRAGVVENVTDDGMVRRILEAPSDYIDSSMFFSWERYFTHLLVEKTRGTWLAYSKKKLNSAYLGKGLRTKILAVMGKIRLSR